MADVLRKEDCEKAVKNFIKSSNFILKDFQVNPLSDKPTGFMGRHFQLTASLSVGGKDQHIRLFVKMAPTCANHRSYVIDFDFFSKEVEMYNNMVPEMKSCLPPGVAYPVPKCFFCRGTVKPGIIPTPGSEDEELIILEDLRERNFVTLEKAPALDLAHCRLVMKTMAKFHAASILLERSYRISHPHVNPADGLFSAFKENFLVNEEGHFGLKYGYTSAESMATAVCKLWPEHYEGKKEELLATMKDGWDRVFEMVKPSKTDSNVLCHGDLWTNNVMFSYGRDRNTGRKIPLDAVFVDLQLVRYAPPVIDILLFLHVCTRRAFREQHLRELLCVYHEDLREYVPLDYLEKFLPLQSLFSMYEKYLVFGRVLSTGYNAVILGENDEEVSAQNKSSAPQDIIAVLMSNKGDSIVRNCNLSKNYKERIMETFQECLEGLGLWYN